MITIAIESALKGFEYLSNIKIDDIGLISSFEKDIKTKADLKVQEIIIGSLMKTNIPILAEELDNKHEIKENTLIWIIDPIDGTLNFSRGFEFYSISIALWNGYQPILGVILDVSNRKIYHSIDGAGAWYDNVKIAVSDTDIISESILATGFPSGMSYDDNTLMKFIKNVQSYKKVRTLGSASLMLALVARGTFDVYQEDDIYLWDVAAGLAILKAAGGEYSLNPGSGEYKYNVKATNGKL